MTYSVIIPIVFVAGLLGGTLSWLIRRAVGLDVLRRHHEVGSAVFQQLGVVFAVLLAFVFNQVWSEYNAVAEAIQQECASLHAVGMMAESLPDAARRRIDATIEAYGRAVVAEEWPAMQRNERSLAAAGRLVQVWRMVVQETRAEADSSVQGQMLTMLSHAYQMRETRLVEATSDVPVLLWVVLLTLAVAMTSSMFSFGIEYLWSQIGFTAVFIGCIVFSLLLVYALDQPFQGAVSISPAGFERLVDTMIAPD
ncbi:MAG: DUF4239 domain-containing protein [Acetobacteraceae bacterium]|nr:DUF4239 domain-containing protein [Acetobacteraceae bacterium]